MIIKKELRNKKDLYCNCNISLCNPCVFCNRKVKPINKIYKLISIDEKGIIIDPEKKKRKIKENSKTNCPKCNKIKPFRYLGLCPFCDDEVIK